MLPLVIPNGVNCLLTHAKPRHANRQKTPFDDVGDQQSVFLQNGGIFNADIEEVR